MAQVSFVLNLFLDGSPFMGRCNTLVRGKRLTACVMRFQPVQRCLPLGVIHQCRSPAQKLFQFSKLPEQCSTCDAAFDKKDREMVQTWKVLVRQEVVRLFCPECIDLAKEAIENVRENTENIERSTE